MQEEITVASARDNEGLKLTLISERRHRAFFVLIIPRYFNLSYRLRTHQS